MRTLCSVWLWVWQVAVSAGPGRVPGVMALSTGWWQHCRLIALWFMDSARKWQHEVLTVIQRGIQYVRQRTASPAQMFIQKVWQRKTRSHSEITMKGRTNSGAFRHKSLCLQHCVLAFSRFIWQWESKNVTSIFKTNQRKGSISTLWSFLNVQTVVPDNTLCQFKDKQTNKA